MSNYLVKLKQSSLNLWLFLAFIIIVILEGALSKWFSISNIISMLSRDILCCIVIIRSILLQHYRKMPRLFKFLLLWTSLIVIYSLLQAIFNQSNPLLLFIGWRFWLIYLWFAVAVACSLNSDEMLLSIQLLMIAALLMVPLAFLQSSLPPSHILNHQVGTDISKIFRLAGEIVRVSGTFSFTLGFTCFVALILPFAFCNKFNRLPIFPRQYISYGLFIAAFALSLFTGSRAGILWFSILYFVYLSSDFFISRTKSAGLRMLVLLGLGFTLAVIALGFFGDNVAAYIERFETASESEVFTDRLLVFIIGEPEVRRLFTALGHGFGLGSNAGALIVTGERGFALAESEVGRILLEAGGIGIIWLFIKFSFSASICVWATLLLKKTGDSLPLLLSISCSYAFMIWPVTGQLSAHAIAYIMLAYLLFLFRTSNFKVKVVL